MSSQGLRASDSSKHVPALDGVRGIAILLVMVFHFSPPALPTLFERLLLKVHHTGWCGIDLFFVLSGFLITGILLDTKSSANYFVSFYARRFLRIFPLYYGALFCAAVVVPLVSGVYLFRSGEQVWYWLYLSNWRSALHKDIYALTHFWTLAIEEQFYLIWPLVVFCLGRRALARVCIGLAALALILRIGFLAAGFGALFVQRVTVARMDSLAMGALIALAVREEEWSVLARRLSRPVLLAAAGVLAAVALGGFGLEMIKPLVQTAGVSALTLLFAGLIFAVADGRSPRLARLLTWRPLRSFGTYSYAMYVLHWPLHLLLLRYIGASYESPSLAVRLFVTYGYILVGIAISYLLARLSWILWEMHFLKWKPMFAPARQVPDAVG